MASLLLSPIVEPSPATVIAYGALMSESSARLTFPDLSRFRRVRVLNYRRVFAHPHLFLIRQGVVDPRHTLRLATLSAEPAAGHSFLAAAFDVTLDDHQRRQFIAREPEYSFVDAEHVPIPHEEQPSCCPPDAVETSKGIMCVASSDELLRADAVPPLAELHLDSVWHWAHHSGLLPADVYLRHCLLAAGKAGVAVERSFEEETFLADRKTTLREWLDGGGERARVMAARPPQHLEPRFSG